MSVYTLIIKFDVLIFRTYSRWRVDQTEEALPFPDNVDSIQGEFERSYLESSFFLIQELFIPCTFLQFWSYNAGVECSVQL